MKSTYKLFFAAYLLFLVVSVSLSQEKLVLFDKKPVNEKLVLFNGKPINFWMKEAYPIGNGRMGGMIFGGIETERIQFNEISLWTGDETDLGSYQNFGDLFLSFQNPHSSYFNFASNYKRTLDIENAIQTVSYTLNDINYKREYFCSFPDKAIIMKFSADKKEVYSLEIGLKDAHNSKSFVENNKIMFAGKLANGLKYEAQALVLLDGGNLTTTSDKIQNQKIMIEKANSFTIILTVATDYSNQRKDKWRGTDPKIVVENNLKNASSQTYESLKAKHIADYQSLFNRVSLSLGKSDSSSNKLTTEERIIAYQNKNDSYLENLQFQFGRYLLISSSRAGGLPANLQGLWNNSNTPPWKCDYHSNINIEMNYWLAEPTNLSECHIPFVNYVQSIREVRIEQTKKNYPNTRGWTCRTENNIFGGSTWRWNPPASAWYAQHLWEHYAFTQNKTYLKDTAYPILKEVCEFWEDHLKKRADGTLVTPDGWSPEQGPTEEGVSYDQELIYDLFTNYIDAADAIKIDKHYRNKIAQMRENLLKPKIGKWGQLQEWETDRDDSLNKHRHVSHLFALHPGRQISSIKTPELFKAAQISMNARGDGGTGWSMAWKINFWARFLDGNHAYLILKNFSKLLESDKASYTSGGIYSNLFCAHPPFQIDGNFGYTAGITEMLIQSQNQQIHLLPALPDAWKDGFVKGLRARGGFEIDMFWKDGKLKEAIIKCVSGTNPTIKYGDKTLSPKLKLGESKKLIF